MSIVSVDQAAPGMVLSKPVTDRRGRLLIPAGQALSDKHVNALKMWGIVSLDIEGEDEVEVVVSVSPESVEAARARLTPLYQHNDLSHPFVRKVFNHKTEQLAREIETAPPAAPEVAAPVEGAAPTAVEPQPQARVGVTA